MTLETTLIFLGAIVLGVTHAFEVDHMTAVSAFVAKRPSPRQAAIFGIQWSVGHGLSLLVFGSVLYALKLTLTESFAHWMERLVGFALLGLGWWTLLQLRAGWQHTHSHQHAPDEVIGGEVGSSALRHTHADGTTHSHSHDHGSFWMGILHGAAGTAAFVGESLVAVSQSYFYVLAFTFAFSVGVLIAMAAYAAALGGMLSWGETRAMLVVRSARVLTGVWACGVGLFWIFK